jgi:hypothetical protein
MYRDPRWHPLRHAHLVGAEASIDEQFNPPTATLLFAKSLIAYKSVKTPHVGIGNSSVQAVRSRLMQTRVKLLFKDGRPNRATLPNSGEGLDRTQSLVVGLGQRPSLSPAAHSLKH